MILGLLLLWFTKKQKIGKALVSIGVLWITLLSYGLFSDGLLKPLERRYLPVMSNPEQSSINDYLKNHVKWVVVLVAVKTITRNFRLQIRFLLNLWSV